MIEAHKSESEEKCMVIELCRQGDIFAQLQRRNDAVQYFRRAYELAHQNTGVLKKLCIALVSNKNYRQTLVYLSKLLTLEPDWALGYFICGFVLYKFYKYEEARKYIEKALLLGLNCQLEKYAYYTLGSIYKRRQEYHKSIKCFDKCIQIDQYDIAAHKQKKFLFQYNQFYVGLLKLEKSTKISDGSMTMQEIIVNYFSLGNIEKGMQLCKKGVEEGNLVLDDKIFCQIGQVMILQGNDKMAEKCFEKAIELNQYENLQIYQRVGCILVHHKKYDEALFYFYKFLQFDKLNFIGWKRIGQVFYNKNDYLESIKYFEQAARLNQKDFLSVYFCGMSYMKLQKNQQAIKYLELSRQINPQFCFAYFALGQIYRQEKKYEQAIYTFQDLLLSANSSMKSRAYYEIGMIKYLQNKYQQSLNYCKQAFKHEHQNMNVKLLIAQNMLQLNQQSYQSFNMFQQVIDQYPDYDLFHYLFGLYLFKMRYFQMSEFEIMQSIRLDRGSDQHRHQYLIFAVIQTKNYKRIVNFYITLLQQNCFNIILYEYLNWTIFRFLQDIKYYHSMIFSRNLVQWEHMHAFVYLFLNNLSFFKKEKYIQSIMSHLNLFSRFRLLFLIYDIDVKSIFPSLNENIIINQKYIDFRQVQKIFMMSLLNTRQKDAKNRDYLLDLCSQKLAISNNVNLNNSFLKQLISKCGKLSQSMHLIQGVHLRAFVLWQLGQQVSTNPLQFYQILQIYHQNKILIFSQNLIANSISLLLRDHNHRQIVTLLTIYWQLIIMEYRLGPQLLNLMNLMKYIIGYFENEQSLQKYMKNRMKQQSLNVWNVTKRKHCPIKLQQDNATTPKTKNKKERRKKNQRIKRGKKGKFLLKESQKQHKLDDKNYFRRQKQWIRNQLMGIYAYIFCETSLERQNKRLELEEIQFYDRKRSKERNNKKSLKFNYKQNLIISQLSIDDLINLETHRILQVQPHMGQLLKTQTLGTSETPSCVEQMKFVKIYKLSETELDCNGNPIKPEDRYSMIQDDLKQLRTQKMQGRYCSLLTDLWYILRYPNKGQIFDQAQNFVELAKSGILNGDFKIPDIQDAEVELDDGDSDNEVNEDKLCSSGNKSEHPRESESVPHVLHSKESSNFIESPSQVSRALSQMSSMGFSSQRNMEAPSSEYSPKAHSHSSQFYYRSCYGKHTFMLFRDFPMRAEDRRCLKQLFFNNHVHVVRWLSSHKSELQNIAPHYYDEGRVVRKAEAYNFKKFLLKVNRGAERTVFDHDECSQEELLTLVASLTEGISELQQIGVYHSDLKLQNILRFNMLRGKGCSYKITDFDWAFQVREVTEKDHIHNNRSIAKAWLEFEGESSIEKQLLKQLFKDIHEHPNELQKAQKVKQEQGSSQAGIDEILLQMEEYMYLSHKQQFVGFLKTLESLFCEHIRVNWGSESEGKYRLLKASVERFLQLASEIREEKNNEESYRQFVRKVRQQ